MQSTTHTKSSNNIQNNTTSPNKNNNTTTQSTKTNTNANTINTPLEEPSYASDVIIGAGLGGIAIVVEGLSLAKISDIGRIGEIIVPLVALMIIGGAIIHGFYKKNKYEEEKQAHDNALHNLTTTNQQTRTPNTK